MGVFWWLVLGCVLLATWAGAVILGGLVGGVPWALGWGLMVYPWLALSAVSYVRAWHAARREEADGTLFLRRCLACGRAVGSEAVLCPDPGCGGVEFGYQWDVHRRDEVFRAREASMVEEELYRQGQRRAEQLRQVEHLRIMPMWMLAGWYWRGMMRQDSDAPEPDRLRWWSSRMLAIGGVFAALVVNATFGAVPPAAGPAGGTLDALMGWGRLLMVLGGALALSAWIAVCGPGSPRARLLAAGRASAGAGDPLPEGRHSAI